MKTLVLGLALALVSVGVQAADQTFSLNDLPKYLDISSWKDAGGHPLMDPKTGAITVANAGDVMSHLFTGKPLDHPFIIHSIVWDSMKGPQVASGADHWYVYDPKAPKRSALQEFFLNDSWTQKRFEGSRIYGNRKITLVYIHQGARGQMDPQEIISSIASGIRSADPNNRTADAAAGIALAKLQSGQATEFTFSDAATNKPITLVCSGYKGCVDSQYTTVTYEVSVTKKTPQPLSDLRSAISIISGQGAGGKSFAIQLENITLWQSKDLDGVLSPSTISVTGTIGSGTQGTQPAKISSTSLTNEGRYWGDVSFAVPLNSYKDITFDDTGSTITPKSVSRENIYVVGDLYWPRVDLQEAQKRLIPHLLAGMPIKKSPLNHLMVGTGVGFNYVEPFVGIVFVRSKQPIPGVTSPKSSSQLETRVNYKFIWGVNMPVGGITKLLSKSTGK